MRLLSVSVSAAIGKRSSVASRIEVSGLAALPCSLALAADLSSGIIDGWRRAVGCFLPCFSIILRHIGSLLTVLNRVRIMVLQRLRR